MSDLETNLKSTSETRSLRDQDRDRQQKAETETETMKIGLETFITGYSVNLL